MAIEKSEDGYEGEFTATYGGSWNMGWKKNRRKVVQLDDVRRNADGEKFSDKIDIDQTRSFSHIDLEVGDVIEFRAKIEIKTPDQNSLFKNHGGHKILRNITKVIKVKKAG